MSMPFFKLSARNNTERLGAQPDCCAGSVLRPFRPARLRSAATRNLSFSQCFTLVASYLDLRQPESPQNLSSSQCLVITLSCPRQMRSGRPPDLSASQSFTLSAPYSGQAQSTNSRKLSFSHCFRVDRSRLDRP